MSEEPICSICKQVISHPELRGKMFQKKGSGPYGVAYSFSATLVQMAGGIDRLLSEWEEEEIRTVDTGNALRAGGVKR